MLEKSAELAYWLGIVQTDGCYNEYFDKRKGRIVYRIIMEVMTSLPMLIKFQEISQKLFKRKAKICRKTTGAYEAKIYIKEYLNEFDNLDFHFKNISIIPHWISNDINLFGAYLAGIIDGDGHILIKRPECPQCLICITSGIEPKMLRTVIIKNFNCSANVSFEEGESILDGRKIFGHGIH